MLLEADGEVAETGRRACSVREIVVVVGNGETKLCFAEQAIANVGFG